MNKKMYNKPEMKMVFLKHCSSLMDASKGSPDIPGGNSGTGENVNPYQPD